MAFREVAVFEIREVLRLWLRGEGYRGIERLTPVDRRTARSYVQAAEVSGLVREGDESQLTDELLGQVVLVSRPSRPDGHGESWRLCAEHRDYLEPLVQKGTVPLTKIHVLLRRHAGVEVPYATLHRYAVAELGFGRRRGTVPIADGEPGKELQVDFGRMGLLLDAQRARRRVCWALILTAVFSRHMFVYLTFSQTLRSLIDGFEAGWEFFGGVFAVIIPDNIKAIVDKADRLDPRFNQGFVEYAQSRGFVIDPARVRHPRDKARVERTVRYTRGSLWAGEDFRDLDQAQGRAPVWCREDAGMRIHGTHGMRPLELFVAEEQPLLLPAPQDPYDLPIYQRARVARDFHIQVDGALYSVPHAFIGCWVDVRADSQLVKVSYRGEVIKHHRRIERGRETHPGDLPADRRDYAMRDISSLKGKAAAHGEAIGVYAARMLDVPLPWTGMRRVYALMGLVGRYGAERVERACDMALAVDVVDIGRIKRILEQALDLQGDPAASPPTNTHTLDLRFARPAAEFRMGDRP